MGLGTIERMKALPLIAFVALGAYGFTAHGAAPNAAEAELKDTNGKKIGTASFLQTPSGVEISIRASGLKPGPHGIHIHQAGKCEGSDFKSAGEHLAGPAVHGEKPSHGLSKEVPHAGDLPNLQVAKDGTVTSEMKTDDVTLGSGNRSLLKEGGTSIVIHENVDDQRSDPAGQSGARIACGVIRPKSPAG